MTTEQTTTRGEREARVSLSMSRVVAELRLLLAARRSARNADRARFAVTRQEDAAA
jgi:hypothetical protein